MTDDEAMALNAFQEADLEPDDGVAAIVRVVLNRMGSHFFSDGTVQGTVFRPGQFSWTQYEMVNGHYTKVAHDALEVMARCEGLLTKAKAHPSAWARCMDIAERVQSGQYRGLLFDRLGDEAVLYDNLALAQPVWATPENLIVQIGHHSFFRSA